MTSFCPATGDIGSLYDKQYKIEKNRFVNPGEDFTPDLPKMAPEVAGSVPEVRSMRRL